jgi:beta-phosphoglucomutase
MKKNERRDMRTKACIFDLDGVIVDTARYHFLAWKRLADQLDIHFTKKDNERLKGVSRTDSLDIILEIGHISLDAAKKKEYADLKNKWYVDFISRMTPDEILPGSLEFINELKSAGINIALGSASKNTPLILKRVGMNHLFDAIADGNVVKKAKPDPEVFIAAAGMVNAEPSQCVVFEDAVAGIRAALKAGMKCVGVGSEKVLKEAHYVISGLDKMNLEVLKSVENLSLDGKLL